LAAADPSNLYALGEVSGSRFNVGRVFQQQGLFPQAVEHHRASLAILERIAAIDQTNARWQFHLAEGHSAVATSLAGGGAWEEAIKNHRAIVAISRRMAAGTAISAGVQRKLLKAYGRLAHL